ncbi:hypothetical protein ABZ477_03960 [Microbacterium sp. NPDC019599]|uniref:hypothetical protein n=1 Tax=Microbacterium sp. NPDC019599 TaxID=3154690 RepID=UPI0033D1A3C5
MNATRNSFEDGTLKPLTESQALEMLTEEDHPHLSRFDRAATEHRLRENLRPAHRVTWVRMSDLLSAGTGRIAGRGIDIEAELSRRLHHPIEVTRQAIRNRSAALPPLNAFGRRRSRTTRDTLGRS